MYLMYRSREFLRVYLIQVVYLFPVAFSWSFVYMYLLSAGFSLPDIFLSKLAGYGAAVASLLMFRRLPAGKAMAAGFLAFALELFVLPFIRTPQELILLGVFDGITFPLFWVPYNTIYFKLGRGGESAFLAGLLFLTGPVLGVLAPVMGGVVLDQYGYLPVFFIGGAVLLAAGAYWWRRTEYGVLEVAARRAWSLGRDIRELVFIQGFWQAADWLCVSIFTLTFLTSGASYGGFLSAVAVAGAFATLYLCRRSDRTGSRAKYIHLSVIVSALATILSAYSWDLASWFAVRVVVGFFSSVSNPFMTSVVLDRVKDIGEGMYLREIMLNLGRAAGIVSVIACYTLLGDYRRAFIVSGLALLAYSAIVEYRSLYRGGLRAEAAASGETMEYHD